MRNIIYTIGIFLTFSCNTNLFDNDLKKILGNPDFSYSKENSISEFAGFGEGYTIEIYILPKNYLKRFDKRPYKLPPKKGWKTKGWSKTPIDSSYNEIIYMVLNYKGNARISSFIKDIKEILNKKDTYYAFYYKPDKTTPTHVNFFVLDMEKQKLYAIDVVY